MVDATKKRIWWSQLTLTVRRFVAALFAPGSGKSTPPADCLALRYAKCNEFFHCRYCSTLGQVRRTAAWVERNWPNVDDVKRH